MEIYRVDLRPVVYGINQPNSLYTQLHFALPGMIFTN